MSLGAIIPLNVPAFWGWFRNSVVRLNDGRPRAVYHGTRSPMDYVAFETGSIYNDDGDLIIGGSMDPGAYIGPHFTISPDLASDFARGRGAKWDTQRFITNDFPGGVAHGRVIPVYLSIQNPIYFNSDDELIEFIFANGDSSVIDDELEAEGYFEEHDEIENRRETYEETFHRITDESYDGGPSMRETAAAELGESIKYKLRHQGFDGIIYNNTIEGGGLSYVTFDPGQVKSVFNMGRWDNNNPNIME